MLQIYSVAVIFRFWLWKNFETSKKTKGLEKDEIKKAALRFDSCEQHRRNRRTKR